MNKDMEGKACSGNRGTRSCDLGSVCVFGGKIKGG